MANLNTNIRGTGQLREESVFDINISPLAAISLSKLANTVIRADGLQEFTGNQSMANNRLTNLGAPIQFSDAANKSYVLEMMAQHTVACASSTNILLSGLPIIDGYQTVVDDRILIMGQNDPKDNGIYVVMGDGIDFVRHDMMQVNRKANGVFVFVNNGSEYGNEGYICNSAPNSIIGTDSITFRQFTGSYGEFETGLEVWGADSLANAATIGGTEDSANFISFFHTGDYAQINSNAGDLSLVSQTGFVGIGTTDPGFTLDVQGDLNFTGDLKKNGVSIGNAWLEYEPFVDVFTASQDQTVFQLTGTPVNTNPKWLHVLKNGLSLMPSDFVLTEVAGVYSITLSGQCDEGDVIQVRPYGLVTAISGLDYDAGNLFVPGELQVGSNSVHINDWSIVGNDPDGVKGQTLNINIRTGKLTLAGDVASAGEIGGLTLDITSNGLVGGNLTIAGDLIVNGNTTTVNTQEVLVADNILVINKNEVGNGVTSGSAGIEVERGTATNYQFMFDESSDTFKVGMLGSLQSVATREDAPNSTGIPYWDNVSNSFKTRNDLTVDLNGIMSVPRLKVTGQPSTPGAGEFYGGTVDPTDSTRLNYNGDFYATKVYNAVWNDIAECMPSDGSLTPGDLCFVDLAVQHHRVTKHNQGMISQRFVGVVSENPGMIVGENDEYENKVYVVLRGMVWTSSLGIYEKGTRLYYTPFGIKSTQEIKQSGIDYLDIMYIGVVIEKTNDKIRIFV